MDKKTIKKLTNLRKGIKRFEQDIAKRFLKSFDKNIRTLKKHGYDNATIRDLRSDLQKLKAHLQGGNIKSAEKDFENFLEELEETENHIEEKIKHVKKEIIQEQKDLQKHKDKLDKTA